MRCMQADCLNCPFAECLEENPVAYRQYRDSMIDRFLSEGVSQPLIALRLGISERTVKKASDRSVADENTTLDR